jgi:LCP family protein required for cell wall assembly
VGTRKINEALFYGGPDLMVRTVEQLSSARIDAYLLAGFEKFRNAVTGIGGLEVRIPYPMSDSKSGAYFQPGRRRLQGPDALAFSRNRYDAPGGDFGRSMNQGRVLLGAMREFQDDLRKDPITLLRWLAVGVRYLDTDLTMGEAADLLLALPSLEPGRVKNAVVSGSGSTVGGQSVVILGSGAQAMFRDLARDGFLGGRS